jgi:hypothetical protein
LIVTGYFSLNSPSFKFLGLNLSISMILTARLLTAGLYLNLQAPNNVHYRSQPLWKIEHRVYWNAVSCLTKRNWSAYGSFPEERSGCIYDAGTWCFWQLSV